MFLRIPSILLILVLASACKKEYGHNGTAQVNNLGPFSRIKSLKDNLENSNNDQILVVAHRGDWRHAPENSLRAIQNCIYMGVDMVEIDVRETKDGHLVLMHDDTIDRTTTGRGKLKNWTLDSLKALHLKDGLGQATHHKIPTLEEALQVTKGKILVNLDKSYGILDKCLDIAERTGTADQIVVKGSKSLAQVETDFNDNLGEVYYMPIARANAKGIKTVAEYMEKRPPIAVEFIVPKDTTGLEPYFRELREKGTSVWINSLWPRLNGGHDDEKAVVDVNTYQWYIDNNVDIIQTDRPRLLLDYLRKKGLHD